MVIPYYKITNTNLALGGGVAPYCKYGIIIKAPMLLYYSCRGALWGVLIRILLMI